MVSHWRHGAAIAATLPVSATVNFQPLPRSWLQKSLQFSSTASWYLVMVVFQQDEIRVEKSFDVKTWPRSETRRRGPHWPASVTYNEYRVTVRDSEYCRRHRWVQLMMKAKGKLLDIKFHAILARLTAVLVSAYHCMGAQYSSRTRLGPCRTVIC